MKHILPLLTVLLLAPMSLLPAAELGADAPKSVTEQGAEMTPASKPNQGDCGIGLDYSSWNGAILRGPGGGIFGVRIGFVKDGRLITGNEFYDQVERSGDYDPKGEYASLTTADLKLEWRTEGNDLYGMVTSKTKTPIVIGCYPALDYTGAAIPAKSFVPFRNPATFNLLNKQQAEGVCPPLRITAGHTQVTGGNAVFTGRKLELDTDSKVQDYFGIQIATPAADAYSGDPAENPDHFVYPRDGIAKTGKITYFLIVSEPNQPITFKAAASSNPVFPDPKFIDRDIQAFIHEGQTLFDSKEIVGSGSLAGWTRPMLNEISWMRMYNPFEKKIVIPAGRPWEMDGRYNCWGWDESFNAMIAAVEDQTVAENNLKWDLGDERIGPLAVWSVYCRQPNKALLQKVYPVYLKIYPPGDSEIVSGQPGWKSGPCDNGNVGKGMDDTPMREPSRNMGLLYSLDMSCMKAWSIECLSRMAKELGLQEDSIQYQKDLVEIRSKINKTFWMQSEGMYRNRYASGAWSITESPTSFYPWLAGCPSPEQSAAMLKNLKDPKKFWGTYVLPTLSRQDPQYGKSSFELHGGKAYPPYCYWRGASWPPPNFLVYEGLKRYQLDEVASDLAVKSVALWAKTWEAKGWSCENYNPETGDRTSMSQAHQSWAMLFPLMGVKELVDVEWWNSSVTLRFGSLAPGPQEIKRIPIRGHLYNVKQNGNHLEVWIDQKPVFKIDGDRVVVHKFQKNAQRIVFEFQSTKKTTVTLINASMKERKTIFSPGTNDVNERVE